ncbi:MAG: hypothetical protein EBR94_06700 [Bacteroidetes bacterium]|nr:hypothetical protein [Bacteroidota bacterium]
MFGGCGATQENNTIKRQAVKSIFCVNSNLLHSIYFLAHETLIINPNVLRLCKPKNNPLKINGL